MGNKLTKKAIVIPMVVIFVTLIMVVAFLSPYPYKVVTTKKNSLIPWGTLEIPSANINTTLYTAHLDNIYDVGLWDGGIIIVDNEEAFSAIELWDFATIEPEGLEMECVAIEPCVTVGKWLIGFHGIIRPEWDVLIVYDNTVYRFRML